MRARAGKITVQRYDRRQLSPFPHAGVLWRSSRRRGHLVTAARWCLRACAERHWRARRCRNCPGSSGSRPCPTVSGRRSAAGQPKRRIITERLWRRRWHIRSETRPRRLIGARTCSSASSWTTGRCTWQTRVEIQRPSRSVEPPGGASRRIVNGWS